MVGLDGTWTGRVTKGLVWRYDYRIIKGADTFLSPLVAWGGRMGDCDAYSSTSLHKLNYSLTK